VEVKALSDMVVEKHNLLLTLGATLEELRGDAAARSDASAGAQARLGGCRWQGGHGRGEGIWEGSRAGCCDVSTTCMMMTHLVPL
jgi:hypothetical protein